MAPDIQARDSVTLPSPAIAPGRLPIDNERVISWEEDTDDMMSTKQMECWIRRCLGAGGFLILTIAVSAALWGLLNATGDLAGAAGARMVTWASIWIWAAVFVALVVLVALRVLSQDDRVTADSSIAGGDRVPTAVE